MAARPPRPTRFASRLAPTIEAYLRLKEALGRKYAAERTILRALDTFLTTVNDDLRSDTFAAWNATLGRLTPPASLGPVVQIDQMRAQALVELKARRDSDRALRLKHLADVAAARKSYVIAYVTCARDNEIVLGSAASRPTRRCASQKTSPQFWMRLQAVWDLNRAIERGAQKASVACLN